MFDPFERMEWEIDRILNDRRYQPKFDCFEVPSDRICASKAKSKWGLTDKDLKALTYKTAPNPMYPRKKVHCYLKKECQALAKAKAERKAFQEDHAEEFQEQRAEAALKRKLAAQEQAERFAKKAKMAAEDAAGGRRGNDSVKLPDTCLGVIMTHVANSLEPGGVRGPSAVAVDLANASLVCWDFRAAAQVGVTALADLVTQLERNLPAASEANEPHQPAARKAQLRAVATLGRLPAAAGSQQLDWSYWDRIVRQPLDLKATELKEAAKQLGVTMSGTKAEVTLRLLGVFGLSAPLPSAPPRISALLVALQLERSPSSACVVWDGEHSGYQLRSAMEALASLGVEGAVKARARLGLSRAPMPGGLAAARRELAQAGFTTSAQLEAAVKEMQEAAAQAARERQAQLQAEREARAQQMQQSQPAGGGGVRQWLFNAAGGLGFGMGGPARHQQRQHPGGHGLQCACGNAAAKACVRSCCANCCRLQAVGAAVVCSRHA